MNTSPLPRLLAGPLANALPSAPVVVVTGARQAGKSTLVQMAEVVGERSYLSLDDMEIRARAADDPDLLVRSAPTLTIDEVQRAPELLLAVKRAVDEERRPGRFILTGSANLLLMKQIAETLAGRVAYFTLEPLSRREQLGRGEAGAWERLFDTEEVEWPDLLTAETAPEEAWPDLALRGGYPTPAHHLTDTDSRAFWFAGYAQTYLERDLRDLSAVHGLVEFRRLMRAACLRLGNLVNQTELGRDVGLPQPTVHRYLALLETSYQLVRLPAYAVNRTKRLIKSPKLYWTDTGVALHLAGEEQPRGAHLENLILTDLHAWAGARVDRPQLLYWRTTTGEEVDFVIEWRGKLLPIEIKATRRPRLADAKSLRTFRAEYPDRTRGGLLLHTGTELGWIADGVLAVPWWRVV